MGQLGAAQAERLAQTNLLGVDLGEDCIDESLIEKDPALFLSTMNNRSDYFVAFGLRQSGTQLVPTFLFTRSCL